MATIVGDVTGLQQRYHPLNIPHLVEKIKGFPLKAKSRFEILQHIKNSGEGFHQPAPPPPTTVGIWICVCVRGLRTFTGSQVPMITIDNHAICKQRNKKTDH